MPKRPQVQERLTMQIVQELQIALGTEDVACVIDAKHLCVNSRGIKDIESSTVTSEFGGKFKDAQVRREFLITSNWIQNFNPFHSLHTSDSELAKQRRGSRFWNNLDTIKHKQSLTTHSPLCSSPLGRAGVGKP